VSRSPPLAHLARAPDATPGELSRLAELARRDPEWPVRARAVELAAGIGPLVPALIAAASDPEPRVREAALKAIGLTNLATGAPAAALASANDPWTFVRVAATEALGTLPQDPTTTNALVKTLSDPSPKVRLTAIGALGKQKLTQLAPRVRERLDDTREDADVRALAARTLGTMCVQNAADRLTKLAQLSRSPVDDADERIGMASIEALGALHPADLAARLAPLRTKDNRLLVRHAAERAIAEPGSCR
jgi:HEAT repeat protein